MDCAGALASSMSSVCGVLRNGFGVFLCRDFVVGNDLTLA